MGDTTIDTADVDSICDRVMASDFDPSDLKAAHYRALVKHIGDLEGALAHRILTPPSDLDRAFTSAEVAADRLASQLGHDGEELAWLATEDGGIGHDDERGVYESDLGVEPDSDAVLGLWRGAL
jgi:hypothetical protein